ncbi:MAG: DUF4157 domain-containing protein [Pyrinomonadaceae bacterium]
MLFKPELTKTKETLVSTVARGLLQRKCACGQHTGGGGSCGACARKNRTLQRQSAHEHGHAHATTAAPESVHQTLRSPGHSLDASTRSFMESRFDHDFSHVRVHTDERAGESARDVSALAYTVGHDVVFRSGQYAPTTGEGRRLIAHELAHVVQQDSSATVGGRIDYAADSSADEHNADTVAEAALAGRPIGPVMKAQSVVQRRAAPYIKKVTVHLTPPQSADLEWEGTPPADATGSDHFTVSTGKGYGDPGDPPGTCTRSCCSDPLTQCAPPYNQPSRVGACCTYYGNTFWTGVPQIEHNGWQWWTPIQPFYTSRGIALHQHTEVTGQPIGHGCVRMDEPNAKRIFDFSNGRRTNVTIDGRAAPVACAADRQCGATGSTGGTRGALNAGADEDTRMASGPVRPIPGMEGLLT